MNGIANVILQVRDARPQRSWSAEFGETLTCAAVVNFINNDYVAVFNEKVHYHKIVSRVGKYVCICLLTNGKS